MAYSVWNTIPGKFIKQDFMGNDFTYEQLKKCWAIIEPSLFKPKISQDRILLFSGLYDQYVLKEVLIYYGNRGKDQQGFYTGVDMRELFFIEIILRRILFRSLRMRCSRE